MHASRKVSMHLLSCLASAASNYLQPLLQRLFVDCRQHPVCLIDHDDGLGHCRVPKQQIDGLIQVPHLMRPHQHTAAVNPFLDGIIVQVLEVSSIAPGHAQAQALHRGRPVDVCEQGRNGLLDLVFNIFNGLANEEHEWPLHDERRHGRVDVQHALAALAATVAYHKAALQIIIETQPQSCCLASVSSSI